MIDNENKNNKNKFNLELFRIAETESGHSNKSLKNDEINDLNKQFTHSLKPSIPDNKIKWAFRVLFNNLLFAGILVCVTGVLSTQQRHFDNNTDLLVAGKLQPSTMTVSSLGGHVGATTITNIEYNQNSIFAAIDNNNMKAFLTLSKNSDLLSIDNQLHISPLQFAIIKNKPDFVKYILEKHTKIPNQNLQFQSGPFGYHYSLLMLPQSHISNKNSNNYFGFNAKKLLIESGADITFNNYQLVKETLGNAEWLSFWNNYFIAKNDQKTLIKIMEESLDNKMDLIKDINKLNIHNRG